VLLLFANRHPADERWFLGLPELVLDGLAEDDTRALLAPAVPGQLDERVRDRSRRVRFVVADQHAGPVDR
jgi:hypothetical protein